MEESWIPIILFLVIGVCVCLALHYRFKSRQEMQLTVRTIAESGNGMSPEALRELTEALFPPRSDLRRGVLLISVGVAFVVLAFLINESDAIGPMIGFSAFPFLMGLAYLGLSVLSKGKS